MIITTANMFYIGNYADVDTDESDYDAENLAPLMGVISDAASGLELVAVTNNDANDNGVIGDDDVFGANAAGDNVDYTAGGVSYSGVLADTTMIATAVLTLDGGGTLTVDVLLIQMDNGDTFVNDISDLDGLSVQSIQITAVTDHNSSGYLTTQSVDGSSVVCFTKGTKISTSKGAIAIEDLGVGDLVLTRDCGFQPIRWIDKTTVPVGDNTAPIEFAPGAIGNSKAIAVSPQHRMLIVDALCEFYVDEAEVLVPAIHLLGLPGVTQGRGKTVTYFHVLIDCHQIILGNDVWSESFHPGDMALRALPLATRCELLMLFPELENAVSDQGDYLARKSLHKKEAIVVLTEILKTGRIGYAPDLESAPA